MTMLVTWLIEIFLNQLGELKENMEEQPEKYEKIQEEFRRFLKEPKIKVIFYLYLDEILTMDDS